MLEFESTSASITHMTFHASTQTLITLLTAVMIAVQSFGACDAGCRPADEDGHTVCCRRSVVDNLGYCRAVRRPCCAGACCCQHGATTGGGDVVCVCGDRGDSPATPHDAGRRSHVRPWLAVAAIGGAVVCEPAGGWRPTTKTSRHAPVSSCGINALYCVWQT